MKRILLLAVITAISATLFSCKKIVGEGPVVSEIRAISNFDKIALSVPADLVYVQSPNYFVEVKGQQNILQRLSTVVVNNELRIRFANNIRLKSYDRLVITVHSPNMNGLELNGSGKIDVPGTISTTNMKLGISGSGSIRIDSLKAQDLQLAISGSGYVYSRKGSAIDGDFLISGSGKADMQDYILQTADAQISGSGTIRISVQQSLDARISGSGNVYYQGNPFLNVQTSGSGRVIKL
jgi:hypothetical protein